MFLASNICWVSSGTVTARNCWLPRAVKGAKPTMKKWRRGKGTEKKFRNGEQPHARENTEVNSHFPQVGIELARELNSKVNDFIFRTTTECLLGGR